MTEGPPINPEEYKRENGDLTEVHNPEFQQELRDIREGKKQEIQKRKVECRLTDEDIRQTIESRDKFKPYIGAGPNKEISFGLWLVQFISSNPSNARLFILDNLDPTISETTKENIWKEVLNIYQNPNYAIEHKSRRIGELLSRQSFGEGGFDEEERKHLEKDEWLRSMASRNVFLKYRTEEGELFESRADWRAKEEWPRAFNYTWLRELIDLKYLEKTGLSPSGKWEEFFSFNQQESYHKPDVDWEHYSAGIIQHYGFSWSHEESGSWFLFELLKDYPDEILENIDLIDLDDPRKTMIALAEKGIAKGRKLAEVAGQAYARLFAFLGGEAAYWADEYTAKVKPASIEQYQNYADKNKLLEEYINSDSPDIITEIDTSEKGQAKWCNPRTFREVFEEHSFDIFMAVNHGNAFPEKSILPVRELVLKPDRNMNIDWWVTHTEGVSFGATALSTLTTKKA